MSNLTPQVRVNKLGVPVIKHVKLDSGAPSSGRKLPAPSLAKPANKPEQPTIEDVADAVKRRTGNKLKPNAMAYGSSYDPKLLRELHAAIESWPQEHVSEIGDLFQGDIMRKPQLIDAIIHTVEDFREMHVNTNSHTSPIYHITCACTSSGINEATGLQLDEYHYGLLKASSLGLQIYLSDPERKLLPHQRALIIERFRNDIDSLVPAFSLIATVTAEYEGPIPIEKVYEIAEYANQHRDRIREIGAFANERKSFDRDLIDQMLASDSSALLEGIL